MKYIDNENTRKAKAKRDNIYTILHTNKYIKHDPSKSTIISMREKRIDKYANAQTTNGCDRVLEKARTRTF